MKTLCTMSFLLKDKKPALSQKCIRTLRSNLQISVLKYQVSLLVLVNATVLSTGLHYPYKKVHTQIPTESFWCKASLCFLLAVIKVIIHDPTKENVQLCVFWCSAISLYCFVFVFTKTKLLFKKKTKIVLKTKNNHKTVSLTMVCIYLCFIILVAYF